MRNFTLSRIINWSYCTRIDWHTHSFPQSNCNPMIRIYFMVQYLIICSTASKQSPLFQLVHAEILVCGIVHVILVWLLSISCSTFKEQPPPSLVSPLMDILIEPST